MSEGQSNIKQSPSRSGWEPNTTSGNKNTIIMKMSDSISRFDSLVDTAEGAGELEDILNDPEYSQHRL